VKQDPEGVTVAKLLEVPEVRNGDVLEIGCGDGRITAGLAPCVKRLLAVDPDEKSLEKAASRLPGVELRRGSGERLDVADRSFHAAIFTLSLHHQSPRKAMEEAARVVKDDGVVLVLEPVAESEIERICRPLNDERHALLAALYAVLESSWKVRHKEVFPVRWVFRDRRELIQWVLEYYGKPFDEETARRIVEPVRWKAEDRPLVVEDRLLLFALSHTGWKSRE